MKKIIFTILLISLLIPVYCNADLSVALKQLGDDIFAMAQDNKEEYSCNGKEIMNEEGNIDISISCCNCKGECIKIIIPTNKTGT
jgi:hypothetical protein